MYWDWVYYLALVIVLICGLFVSILGLPGLWLMLGAAGLYAWITGGAYLGMGGLVALLVLAVVAEIVEFVAGGAGAKKAGGGMRAFVGAVIGGLLGGFFLTFVPIPVIGTIVGVCLGTFLGALAAELWGGRDTSHSIRVGVGAAKGRLWGILSKLAFGIAMLLVAAGVALPIGGRPSTTAPPATAPATTTAVP